MRTRSQGPISDADGGKSESRLSVASDDPARDGGIQLRPNRRSFTDDSDGASRRTSVGSAAASPSRPQSIRTTSSPKPSKNASETRSDLKLAQDASIDDMAHSAHQRRARMRSPWACSPLTLLVTALAAIASLAILRSFLTRQLDPKGCAMSYMRSAYAKYSDFDTEHTRFASKYSLYLYRELGIDEDTRVQGIPVLFIPGNAGSYRQVRPFAAEAATYFNDIVGNDRAGMQNGKLPLDFFTVDFNEDITAFHGQTLLDQAEYLNEAIAYILSLYHNLHRSNRVPDLPDPSSVIIIGHSMGGIVARTMLTMPNYQANSINTIITLAAPHARPPVSFDADIVNTYKKINDYWRRAYSQKWANDNPLWHVTLISIAGGGLDTVVPSDYSTLASLVPATHGFTVFTSTIPRVWTGVDHLAIIWCDQLRKSVIRALYEVADASRPAQTRPRAERMQTFKKWFLTGMEDMAEKTLPHKEPKTLLTLEDNSNAIISQGERLSLRSFGQLKKPKAYLLPIPPQGSPDRKRFTLLTSQVLDRPAGNGSLEVMFCSVFPLHAGQSSTVFSMNMDLSGDSSGSTRLACKNAASDTILLPASTRFSKYPFDNSAPFSYLQYNLEELAEHQFVAVVDKADEHRPGWLVAEFSSRSDATNQLHQGVRSLIASGVHLNLPADRPTVMEIKIPSIDSSLLSYHLSIGKQSCKEDAQLFTPLVRQYISEPYESKYFVNVEEADISLHGIAPYIPPAMQSHSTARGLTLQIWSDATCNSTLEVSMEVDLLGSMGKLWMRYRTVFAAFPLLVVALVMRKQFQVYDRHGVFMSFSESMDQSIRRSVLLLLAALTLLAMSFSRASQAQSTSDSQPMFNWGANRNETNIDFSKNDRLLGSQDPFFWFLVPLFGAISVGICVALNYALLVITYVLAVCWSCVSRKMSRSVDGRITNVFVATSLRKRVITTGVLLLLVSTIIPYQFAYIVLCIVQIATCVRALGVAQENVSGSALNFYNYVHSLLMLMLWILPINLPVLVVWIHNLTVHWLTPFSSHHNILSILPFILLVETMSTGKMIPQVTSYIRHFTSMLCFGLAVYAAVYGVTYAYLLHFIANGFCAWLMGIYLSSGEWRLLSLLSMSEAAPEPRGRDIKKRP